MLTASSETCRKRPTQRGVQLVILKASTESEIDAAFASLVQLHAGALVDSPDPFYFSRREQLVALAARHSVPMILAGRDAVTASGLISYGPSLSAVYRQAGVYIGKILDSAKPADMPSSSRPHSSSSSISKPPRSSD